MGGMKMHYVYIVECNDQTYYTGYTNNLKKRMLTHNRGKGAKYTRCRLPVKLIYFEEHGTKTDGMKREYQIKRMTRKQKEILIKIMGKE